MTREELAKQLFLTDWPNDKWERFKDRDHAKQRYLRMADTALFALYTPPVKVETEKIEICIDCGGGVNKPGPIFGRLCQCRDDYSG